MKKLIALVLCIFQLWIPAHAAPREKLVALTFDDGPSGRFTRRLLEGLEERDAKATFFLCGYRMEQYPELTQQIFNEGHEIGLHGYSHRSMKSMNCADVVRELEEAADLLPEGCEVSFLRSPGGFCGNHVLPVAQRLGLSFLSWSVDPKDWATKDAGVIEKEVLSHIRDGDVILLHDMSDSSVDAALMIINELREQGFRFVTVSQLAQAKGISLVPGQKYTRF